MNNKIEQDYWTEREARKIVKAEQQLTPAIETIDQIYKLNEQFALAEISKIFKRGLKGENLAELEQSQNFKDFITRAKQAGFYTALPDAYKFRADRLTALNREIWLNAKQVGQAEYIKTSQGYGLAIAESWRNTFKDHGAGKSYQNIPFETLERIMTLRPNGEDFANAIWRNTDRLANRTMEILASGIQLGKSQKTMARELSELTNETIHNANRIVRTETAYYYNQITLEQYRQLGIERYRFIAVLDRKTSAICHSHEGETFEVAKAQVGVNFPPLHPNCRSGTIAVYDDEEDPYTMTDRLARYDFNSEPYIYDGRHPATFAGANEQTTANTEVNLNFADGKEPAQANITQAIVQNIAEFPQVARTISNIETTNKFLEYDVDTDTMEIKVGETRRLDDTHNATEVSYKNEIKIRSSPTYSTRQEFDEAFSEKIKDFLFLKTQGFTNHQIDRMAKAFNYGKTETQTLAHSNATTPSTIKLAKKYNAIRQNPDFEPQAEQKTRTQFLDKTKTVHAKMSLIWELKDQLETQGVPELPFDIFKRVMKMPTVSKSPYGFSFYDSHDIGWEHKPEGSIRISDHWNFDSRGKVHAKIKGVKSMNTIQGWKIARYEQGEYVVLEEFDYPTQYGFFKYREINKDIDGYKKEIEKYEKIFSVEAKAQDMDLESFRSMFVFSRKNPAHEMSKFFTEQLHKELNK